MNVNTLSKAELWDLIDRFGVQNKIVVSDTTVRFTNQYHDKTYPIRTEQDLGPWDRIVDITGDIYLRRYNLFFCYNEGKREHFFIDRASYHAWKIQIATLVA